ncbi:hypothetical protein HaLaN_27897 [Haematococcus lacustris]|uniref:Uncharacterized protein n=1 Tax=Haematococcus lacustris TaxID=44745 RepID=A0A6A0AA74_HAELA|nr:hypothetical protein HaLaN_27897 [Haematococcus lacustris]
MEEAVEVEGDYPQANVLPGLVAGDVVHEEAFIFVRAGGAEGCSVKQLMVFIGIAGISAQGGWIADEVLRACCKAQVQQRGKRAAGGKVPHQLRQLSSEQSAAVRLRCGPVARVQG